jgi:glycosyltransferase involved in cell wall biosynthesis
VEADSPPSPLGFDYVLYVSILNYYKAQLEVVEAWAELRKTRATAEKLVLAGFADSPYAQRVRERISQLGLTDEVLLVGDVPHRNLSAWYRHAKVNLFASSCENCPFILLEAMGAGRPTLSSNYPPMPELAGTGAEYFDPYNPPQLARLLQRCLDDEELRAEMGTRAAAQSRNFTWERAATATWDLLIAL